MNAAPIADARERLISAALTLADAVSAATREHPVDAAKLAEFRDADAHMRSLSAAQRKPHRRHPAALESGQFSVSVGEDGFTVVLANSRSRAQLEPDHARGLAAALNATAEHVDQPRQLRRRRDVDEQLRNQEG